VKLAIGNREFVLLQGNDIDAFYLGDILRALGCNCTNTTVLAKGGAEALGELSILAKTRQFHEIYLSKI
jgi:hypothetical protein